MAQLKLRNIQVTFPLFKILRIAAKKKYLKDNKDKYSPQLTLKYFNNLFGTKRRLDISVHRLICFGKPTVFWEHSSRKTHLQGRDN